MDEKMNKSLVVDKSTFDCIALRGETQPRECSTTHSQHSMISRHLQEDKSNSYSVISAQKTGCCDDASSKEITTGHYDESKGEIPQENLAWPSKQRRLGVVQSDNASSDERQRKIGIAEDKESVSDRTFLRVLHKKF
jgi:hypothetical protein